MKTTLSAIALGALLACNFATAQVTITQQGTGNGAYTEQQGTPGPTPFPIATTIQIGNNNHAGDPVSHTPGILQREPFWGGNARIYQEGDENTANIVQDGVVFPVNAIIEQRGNGNTAAITQTIQTYSDGTLYQNGNNNLAILDQRNVTDSGFSAVQNGSDNKLSVLQMQTVYGIPSLTQTGSGNSITLDLERLLGSGPVIEQVGSMNTVDSIVRDGEGIINAIQQNGTGNTALTYLIGGPSLGSGFHIQRSVITQTGDNNSAIHLQEGPSDGYIKQAGNDNSATLTQTYVGPGESNIGYIKQIGNGFTASLAQNGAANNAGVYQH
jgi:hypothetical protein